MEFSVLVLCSVFVQYYFALCFDDTEYCTLKVYGIAKHGMKHISTTTKKARSSLLITLHDMSSSLYLCSIQVHVATVIHFWSNMCVLHWIFFLFICSELYTVVYTVQAFPLQETNKYKAHCYKKKQQLTRVRKNCHIRLIIYIFLQIL